MTKNTTIGVVIFLMVAIAGAIIILYFFPMKETVTPADELSFININKGQTNAIEEKREIVVRSSSQWSDLWNEMFPTEMIASAIDFNNKMLIGVFLGERATAGYEVSIEVISEFPDKIQVGVVERIPGVSCMTAQMISSPYHIVEVDKSTKPIEFSYSSYRYEC